MSSPDLFPQVNVERVRDGEPAFIKSAKLTTAAQRHADDMAKSERVGHNGSDGSTFTSRASDAGYRWSSIAENAAQTFTAAPVECTNAWRKSPGHKAAMLGDYHECGCGVAQGASGLWYWCLLMATPASVGPKPFPPPADNWLTRLLKRWGLALLMLSCGASELIAMHPTWNGPAASNESLRQGF